MAVAHNYPIDMSRFADAIVLDENGKEFQISSFWREVPAILIFLRHFGCIACRAHAAEIWHKRQLYERDGARIYFIGNGKPEYIRAFKEDLDIHDAPIYTDPSLVIFAKAGFRRGFRNTISRMSAKNFMQLFAAGHRQTLSKGDIWQLGGMMVVKPGNRLAYHYISEALGDFPPEKDLHS